MSIPFSFADAQPFWQAMAARTPLIHCITNSVAVNLTANVLLAAGASPAMVVAEEEIEAFTAVAANLSLNVGTIDRSQMASMALAAKVAAEHGKPWVLDPVAVGDLLVFRSDFVQQLLKHRPAVIRGNAGEIMWLAGEAGQSRGADSLSSSDDALSAAKTLAKQQQCVVAVTGERDYVSDGETTLCISGGSELQTRVTACGCSLTALVAAFVAEESDTLRAAAAACALMKHAGSYAAEHSQGMGGFASALLDGLTYHS